MICMKKILCLFITSLLIFASTTFVFADSIDRQKSFETVEEPLNSVNSLPSFEDFQLTNETNLNVTDEEDSIGPWEYEDLSSEQLLTLLLSNLTEDNTFIISGWSLTISSNNLINIDTLNTVVNNVRSDNILLDTFLNRTDALKVIRKCISDYDVNDSNIEYSFLRYLDDYINGELTYEQGIIKAR